MKNIDNFFKCKSCGKEYSNGTEFNRHLSFCELYDDWLKTYIPPVGIKCDKCNKLFTKKEYFDEHKC